MLKGLLLFSGGLDSVLAVKILEKQKIKITPICFKSYFFNCDSAEKSAKKLKLKLKIVDFSKEHFKIIKKPKYGFGKRMNPCIDCHLLMLKTAKRFVKLTGNKFDFIATGDVVDERPFSQRKKILLKMDKEAGLEGLILRPLSAKLLPESVLEKKGLVKREELFAFHGKSRKLQLRLAKEFKIKDRAAGGWCPTPAGGCILTDLEYSKKLKELFNKISNCNSQDAQVLKKGRVFWENRFLIIVGRNEKENKELKKLKAKEDLILEPENFSGPAVLIRGFGQKIEKITIKKAVELLLNYSKKLPEEIKISLLKKKK